MPNRDVVYCADCENLGFIHHKQEYWCRDKRGLIKLELASWCCYGKKRQDVLEREMNEKHRKQKGANK